MTIKYELPYSAEIRAKHCEPNDDIDFGERYCEICGKELSPHFRLVGFWETDKSNGVIVETDDGEQRLLSHEQYKDLMKARKSKGKNNETA